MKEHIFYHRSYRTLGRFDAAAVAGLVCISVLFDLVLVLFHTEILTTFVNVTKSILAGCGLEAEIRWMPFLPFLIRDLPVLQLPATMPSAPFSLVNLIVSLLLILVLTRVRILPLVLRVYLVFVSLLNTVSSLFFLIAPNLFPYDLVSYSIIYLGLELAFWVLLPLILPIILITQPGNVLEKFTVVVGTVAYSMVFNLVRYASVLLIMTKFSVLYMAVLLFGLGPFIDFIYVVSIFSLYQSRQAQRLAQKPERWQWLH